MGATWLFYYFLKLEVHILHRLENQFLIFENYDLSDMTSFSVKWTSYFRKFPKISEVGRFPFGDSLIRL